MTVPPLVGDCLSVGTEGRSKGWNGALPHFRSSQDPPFLRAVQAQHGLRSNRTVELSHAAGICGPRVGVLKGTGRIVERANGAAFGVGARAFPHSLPRALPIPFSHPTASRSPQVAQVDDPEGLGTLNGGDVGDRGKGSMSWAICR